MGLVREQRRHARNDFIRQGTGAPEPQRIGGHFACLDARLIDRMVVQDHLRFVQQGTPALAFLALRQVLGEISADGVFWRNESRQTQLGLQLQVPTLGIGGRQRHADIAEDRLQGLDECARFLVTQSQFTDRHQPHTIHFRLHKGRIGAQPKV